jgi:hypothetical protein
MRPPNRQSAFDSPDAVFSQPSFAQGIETGQKTTSRLAILKPSVVILNIRIG